MTQIEQYSSSSQEPHRAGGIPLSEELTPHDQDQDLLLALQTGSSDAFERLQKLYSNRLYKRIISITRNHEDAEDALQDTFMHAFLAFATFQRRSHVSTWLTRIAINSALTVIRRRRRAYAVVSLAAQSKPEADVQEFDVRDSAPTPEEICDLKQRFERVSNAIERLDPKSRIAIGIQITQECSLKELAHSLDVSVAAVKARIHRARKKLAHDVDHTGRILVSQKHRTFEHRTQLRAATCLICD